MKPTKSLMYAFVASMKPGLAEKTGTVYHDGRKGCPDSCNCKNEYPNKKGFKVKSYTCKEDRHQDCIKILISSSNKRFRCDCECHPKEVKRPKVVEVEDED